MLIVSSMLIPNLKEKEIIMYKDSWLELFVELAALGSAYCIGNNVGTNRTRREIEDKYRDDEIRRLKEEIDQLKRK
jgi:hypothetical protein